MAKSKKEGSRKADFAKGGNTKMFGKQHVGQQKAGVTSHAVGADGKFATGGNTKMHGFRGAMPAKPGYTSC